MFVTMQAALEELVSAESRVESAVQALYEADHATDIVWDEYKNCWEEFYLEDVLSLQEAVFYAQEDLERAEMLWRVATYSLPEYN